MHKVWTVVLGGLLLGGCTSTNISDLITALGKDNATVCVTVTSVYGTAKGFRTNALNATVKCDQEGMSVSAGTPMIVVPSSQFTPAIPTQK